MNFDTLLTIEKMLNSKGPGPIWSIIIIATLIAVAAIWG